MGDSLTRGPWPEERRAAERAARELRRRTLVPHQPTTEREHARLLHQDLEQLTEFHIFAERVRLTDELTRLTFSGKRPRLIFDGRISDQDWMVERLGKLNGEEQRRRSRAAA